MRGWAGICLLAALGAAAALAQETPLTRAEDGSWVRTNGDSFPIRPSAALRIVTAGDLVVRGGDVDRVRFQFEQRVKAPSHDAAARAMGALTVSANAFGGLLALTILPRSALPVHTRIEVTVPRGLPQVVVENQAGSVELYDLNGNVTASTGGGHVRADRLQGNLLARTVIGRIEMGAIGGAAQASSGGGSLSLARAGGEANLHTLGGDIQIGETGGPVEATTEGGNVRVERAGGDVRTRSVAGVIAVEQARGTVHADTRSGSVQVGSALGVKAESASGMVRVRGASGPLVLSTLMGDILAELVAGARLAESTLAAGSGNITVEIPAGFGVNVLAHSQTGLAPRIVSDFPEIQTRSVGWRPPAAGQIPIYGGGPVLNLNTNGGVIYLRRVK
jgi:DUF4097 and DUF4098 domain-containing protein YvlB